jgi:hypothetical protein
VGLRGAGFLFPLKCREYFTNCTAFGISRTQHSMQQRVQRASASDHPSDVRIGRILGHGINGSCWRSASAETL